MKLWRWLTRRETHEMKPKLPVRPPIEPDTFFRRDRDAEDKLREAEERVASILRLYREQLQRRVRE